MRTTEVPWKNYQVYEDTVRTVPDFDYASYKSLYPYNWNPSRLDQEDPKAFASCPPDPTCPN